MLAGGTLAVAVARPEDVRHPTLAAFAGGPSPGRASPPPRSPSLRSPRPPAGRDPPAKAIPLRARAPSKRARRRRSRATRAATCTAASTAAPRAYGLGEVHLLAFDPTRKPALDDPWAQARVVDLARRAFDRRSTQVFRPGADARRAPLRPRPPAARSRTRARAGPSPPPRSCSCVYAVLAGPVNFSLAASAGRPLRALRRLPIFSAVAFALVVAIGVAAKGITGRARHLTLVEAGAGMPRGSARRFRGFYASRAKDLTVRTTDASSVVSMPSAADYGRAPRSPRRRPRRAPASSTSPRCPGKRWWCARTASRRSATASRWSKAARTTSPWSTAPGAICAPPSSASPSGDGVLLPPHQGRRSRDHPRRQKMSDDAAGRAPGSATQRGATRLGASPCTASARRRAPARAREGRAGPRRRLVPPCGAAGGDVNWFPDGVPVLLAQLEGGEGRLHDAGLRAGERSAARAGRRLRRPA